MSIASRITDLVTAAAVALNARNAPGPSDFQMWLAAGNTGTIDNYRASILGADADFASIFTAALGTTPQTQVATSSQAGITQLATTSEAQAGTNFSKALTPAGAISLLNAQQDLLATLTGFRRGTAAQRAALAGAQLFQGLRFSESDTGITYRYNGTAWRAWESDWTTLNTFATDVPGATLDQKAGRWRYNSGRCLFEGRIRLASGAPTQYVRVQTPVTVESASGLGVVYEGEIRLQDYADNFHAYKGAFYFDTTQTIRVGSIGYQSNAQATGYIQDYAGSNPFAHTWAVGTLMDWSIQYDPA